MLVSSLVVFISLGLLLVLCGFIASLGRLLNCLIVVENFNVLLLFGCVLYQIEESRMMFIALMVIFTVEVVLGLVVITRLWDISVLIGLVGW